MLHPTAIRSKDARRVRTGKDLAKASARGALRIEGDAMGKSMTAPDGFFVDWDGNARSTSDPGGGYVCDIDLPARYVAVSTPRGALVHEATFYRSVADIEKAGIRAPLVPGAHPWGRREDGL
jgi:hypothetical protein